MKTAAALRKQQRGTSLGRLFRAYMLERGVTQEALAKRVRCSQGAISFLLNGKDGGEDGSRYLGLKLNLNSAEREPLAYRVRKSLGVPWDEFNSALLKDLKRFSRASRVAEVATPLTRVKTV